MRRRNQWLNKPVKLAAGCVDPTCRYISRKVHVRLQGRAVSGLQLRSKGEILVFFQLVSGNSVGQADLLQLQSLTNLSATFLFCFFQCSVDSKGTFFYLYCLCQLGSSYQYYTLKLNLISDLIVIFTVINSNSKFT